ncbi:MAG: hypothetical protein NTW86_01965 [Candidatus Sumerlaeota bacterium]|nr:hypothetical protein [Candidatus Sumerlaeota bacterium]
MRTHDFFGPVDIDAKWTNPDRIARFVKADASKCVFPDWGADPEEEASYNWEPTDRIIQGIIDCGAQAMYRIGRSWAADPEPPADFDKYAEIVRRVAMHYNGGWSHGFHYGIRYWEMWNEPDLTEDWAPGFARPFWSGAPQQFYRLYEKVARVLKAYDSRLKIGGPAVAGGWRPGPYREGLIAYCAAHKVPLDFFSWRRYTNRSLDPNELARIGEEVRRLLDAHGLRTTENIVDEWNIAATAGNPQAWHFTPMESAAFSAAAQIYMQDSPIDRSLRYRGDATGVGLFEADGRYRKAAFAYKALGEMLDTPRRLAARGGDTSGFAILAGRSEDGKTVQALVCNYRRPASSYGPSGATARAVSAPMEGGFACVTNPSGYMLVV